MPCEGKSFIPTALPYVTSGNFFCLRAMVNAAVFSGFMDLCPEFIGERLMKWKQASVAAESNQEVQNWLYLVIATS